MSHNKTLVPFLKLFFHHQTAVKMSHFQTESYAVHKETDAYLLIFSPLFDRFMEVLQGSLSKVKVKKLECEDIIVPDSADDLIGHLRYFRKTLHDLCKDMKGLPGLMAVRDELMSNAEQLIYVLTFK
jgi:hypothetical protein